MFDKLLLLGPVGRTVYFGPTGKAVIDYFESRGALACGPDTNPAEWLLDITNSLTNKDGETWTDLWQASEEKMHVKDALNALNSGTASNEKQSSQDTSFCLSRSPFLVQLRLVTHRRLLDYWRSPSYLYSKICLCVGAVSSSLSYMPPLTFSH